MPEAYSVTQLNTYIANLFAMDYNLQDVWVTGEVSNLSRAASGHWYFTLKDSKAQLKCVMWRNAAERQTTIPRSGDSIVVHGYLGVYEQHGVYQLYADHIQPVGVGDLYQRFEQLKAMLEAEGLFDDERKRPLPAFPQSIGIVTSADAAALQDVLNVLRRRFPIARVVLSACLVQGDDAPPQICAALERMHRHASVDVIILCRGGGSIEDLWAFNDERVVRMVAASPVPVVCGVGHEIDFTLSDFAADLRAPTPSAAAELATPNLDDLRLSLLALDADLRGCINDCLTTMRDDLSATQRALRHVSPAAQVRNMRQRVDDWNTRLVTGQDRRFALLNERLTARRAALNAANPHAILARGYAIVYRSDDGEQVASANDAKPGTRLTLKMHDGDVYARTEDKDTHEQYKRTLF